MGSVITKFLKDECGGVAMEYGLVLVLITVGIIGSVVAMGESVQTYLGNALGGLMAR